MTEIFWSSERESLPETHVRWPTMTVLCAETRAAVLEKNLNRKISVTEGVDTTARREQVCSREEIATESGDREQAGNNNEQGAAMRHGNCLTGIAKSTLVALALLMSISASATVLWHTSMVKAIYPYAGGSRFVLAFETESPNCTNAQTPRKYYYVLAGVNGVTANDVKAVYALAMFAMSQEKPLAFVFDDSTSNCYINAMKLGE